MSFRSGRTVFSVAAGLLLALTAFAGSASATLPGKNGPLLISSFVKEQSINYSTFLFTQPVTGKATKLIGGEGDSYFDGAVSPNGRQIVFTRYPGYQLWLGSFNNPRKAQAITALDPERTNGASVFSPDGKSIYYSATYYTPAGVGWHLRRYDIKSKKTKFYKVNQQRDWGFSDVSPNGRWLAYNRGSDEHKSAVRFMDTKTGKSRAFKFKYPTNGASFSPDGKWIVFTANVKHSPEIFMSRLNGKGSKRLTNQLKTSYYPVFSPNGRQVAFTQGSDAYKRIGIITLKTGKIKYLKAPGDYSEVEQWLRK